MVLRPSLLAPASPGDRPVTGSPWPPQCGGLEQPAHEGAGYARFPQHQPGRKSPISPRGLKPGGWRAIGLPRASTSQQGAAPPAPSSPREALRARETQMSPNLFLARYKKIETAGNRLDPVAI
jgi:hypothetical protein